ncbi:apoptosis-enhancing nuclease-like [Athene cunicularia]|nr:apoptosis-enhancing nuclease-like [Athene cunicularia]
MVVHPALGCGYPQRCSEPPDSSRAIAEAPYSEAVVAAAPPRPAATVGPAPPHANTPRAANGELRGVATAGLVRACSQNPAAGPEARSTLAKTGGTVAQRCGKVPKPKHVVSSSLSPSTSPDSIARHHSVLLSWGNSSARGVRMSSALLRPGKYVAIDCEMVGTGPQGRLSELARCSVVNYEGDVIYDKYVQPELPIVDYRTRWSGITKQHMKSAIPFKAAQAEILKILKDKIVVGHAIHNDFQALKYFHPKDRTRDTSRIPILNQRAGLPSRANVSLKSLARHLLQKKIQVGCKGHSSVEDAQTAMELYRLVEVQWETELARSLPPRPPSPITDPTADSNQYMDDRYWPTDLMTSSL